MIAQVNIYITLTQEVKDKSIVYMHSLAGYMIKDEEADSRHSARTNILWREAIDWKLEDF